MKEFSTATADGVSITVDEALCKGCGICVSLCPTDVYDMTTRDDATTVATPARPEDCIECENCELLCPDFALEVEPVHG